MKKDVYLKRLHKDHKDSFEEIVENFHDSIIETNRDHKFFVNWEKIKSNVEKFKIELSILDTLIRSPNFDRDLRKILSNYPEVIPCFPILIALRDMNLKVIDDFSSSEFKIVDYDFNKRELSDSEIQEFINFFEKTGLKDFFLNLSSKGISDYVVGVEVGMDTNARKNRSGDAMERVLKPLIERIGEKLNFWGVLFQKKFDVLEKEYGIDVSSAIKNRKSDFIVVKNKENIINIEVDFFSVAGSKPQEIVGSYINRQDELLENGFKFIWITDGYGWRGQKNQIRKGFERIDYLLNVHFVREGLLEDILCEI